MCDISIPTTFEDLPNSASNGFHVIDDVNIEELSKSDLIDLIEDLAAIDLNNDDYDNGLPQDKIDFIFGIITKLEFVDDDNKTVLTESLISLVEKAISIFSESLDQKQKNAIKIIFYFFLNFTSKIEVVCKKSSIVKANDSNNITIPKGRGKSKAVKDSNEDSDTFSLNTWRVTFLQLINSIICLDPSKVWTMGIIPESFLLLLWKLSIQLLEDYKSDGSFDSNVKSNCIKNLIDYTSKHGSNEINHLVTAFLDALCRSEHIAPILADIVKQTNGIMATELIGEIGQMNMSELAKSGSGVKHVGMFLTSFAELCPDLMTQHLASIMRQIDSEVYQIRSAIIQSIGIVVSYIHQSQKTPSTEPKIDESPSEENEEIDMGKKNTEHLNRAREKLLDVMVERTYDNNSFTRAVVIKTWISLVEAGSVPVRRIGSVAEIAVDRLVDKTAAVRKAALNLLTVLLECNPFNANLDISIFKSRAAELSKSFDARVKVLRELINGPVDVLLNSLENETKNPEEIDDEFLASEEVISDPDIVSIVAEKEYCNCAIELLTCIETAIPRIEEMTRSKNLSDITEALVFYSRAVNFNIQGAGKAFTNSFFLIWHHDEAVRNECIMAFKNVFLTDGASTDPQPLNANEIVTNLAGLVNRCDVSEIASLEKIVGELFKSNIDANITQALWAKLFHASDDGVASGNYLKVLTIVAKCVPEIINAQKIKLILRMAMTEISKETPNFSVLASVAKCLQTTSGCLNMNTNTNNNNIKAADSEMKDAYLDAAPVLRDLILGFWCPDNESDTRKWFDCCEESMHALFHTHPSPDKVISSILVPMYATLASSLNNVDGKVVTSSSKLAKLLFVLGQAAICSLVYTEKIANLAKKSNEAKQKAEVKEPENAKNKKHQNVSDAMEEEMGLVAAADAEHERIYYNVIERQLVCDNILGKFHLLIAYVVANEKENYSNPLLRETAVLALCRFMSVSSELCETYLPLLFTIVEREKSEAVRTTVMIAIGDLSFRFPNSLEPWTAHMYSRLSDKSVLVRYNTLMTLTHLILNDMIKVKGQVTQMVLCLNDSNEKVRDLACLFFTELSKRSNNPVYNLLGDIISILSRGEVSSSSSTTVDSNETFAQRILSEKEFQESMTFLLKFVQKDKQADSLLERLLVRISLSTELGQKRNLAFCISQLPITEKGVKKMIELIKTYKDALYDSEVYDYFKQCISKTKKTNSNPFAKKAAENSASEESSSHNTSNPSETEPSNSSTNIKSVVEEFENILSIIKDLADGNSTTDIDFDSIIATVTKTNSTNANDENAAPSNKNTSKKQNKKSTKDKDKKQPTKQVVKSKSSHKKMQWSDDEEEDFEDSDIEEEFEESEPARAIKPSRSRQAIKN